MIIGSYDKLEIGKRYCGTILVWINGETIPQHEVPYVPIRESNYKEWLEDIKSRGGRQIHITSENGFFYEISVD